MRAQRSASADVARSVEQLVQAAEHNSAAAQDSASTAAELTSMADKLQAHLAHFKT